MTDNKDMEMRLLGRIMSIPKEYYNSHSLMSEGMFTDPLNRKIYKVVSDRLDLGEKVDLVILTKLVKDSLAPYRLAECYSLDFSHYNTEHMILFLSQEEKKIRLKKLIEVTNNKLNRNDDLFEVLDYVETELKPISEVRGSDIPDIKKQLKVLHDDIQKRMSSDEMVGVPTGFQSIDKFTGGWQETDFIVIGGASSMGETQLLQRLVSLESSVNNRYIMKGTLQNDELARVDTAIGKLERTELYVDECKDSSLRYLLNKIRQYVITKSVKFVLVDYLQLVKGSGHSREQEVAMVARELKNIAKELNITIVALSQLSRSVEKRGGGNRPMLSDLRESGEIEQASDIVMLVYRPEYYGIMQDDNGNNTEGLVDLIFAKGRNIGTGVLPLKFEKEYTRFSDPTDYGNDYSAVQGVETSEAF